MLRPQTRPRTPKAVFPAPVPISVIAVTGVLPCSGWSIAVTARQDPASPGFLNQRLPFAVAGVSGERAAFGLSENQSSDAPELISDYPRGVLPVGMTFSRDGAGFGQIKAATRGCPFQSQGFLPLASVFLMG